MSVTLKMQLCVDGFPSPWMENTPGRGVREVTRCPSVGRPLTSPPGQLQVYFTTQPHILFYIALMLYKPHVSGQYYLSDINTQVKAGYDVNFVEVCPNLSLK